MIKSFTKTAAYAKIPHRSDVLLSLSHPHPLYGLSMNRIILLSIALIFVSLPSLAQVNVVGSGNVYNCLLYTSPSPRDS